MNKELIKSQFESNLKNFVSELQKFITTENGEWSIKGFIDVYKNLYTISSDTKIVSKILEIHIFPELLRLASETGYYIVLAEHQNWYPDLTLVNKSNDKIKFALDLKTTFRRNNKSAGFTLGSHGAYFKERDKSKNIQFPYNEYSGHYCLGIIYTRNDMDNLSETEVVKVKDLELDGDRETTRIGERQVTTIENLKSVASVIKDFEFFAAPKWKIASDSQGSGNTANIGSIKDIDDLKSGNGVFSKLGEHWFDEYWMNYGTVTMIRNGKTIKVTNVWDFLEFKGREDLWNEVVEKGAKRRPKK